MKIDHFAIEVSNIDQSAEFYVKKLGFEIKIAKTDSEDGLYSYMDLDLGGAELEIIEIRKNKMKKNKKTLPPPICPHIALETNDFERDLQILREKGVSIFDGPHIIPNDVKIMTILDPDSYRIDIGQLI